MASEIQSHHLQVQLQKLNVVISAGKYQLAATPCHASTRCLNCDTVPCAQSMTGESTSCFTCRVGKTTCSFVQDAEGQVKIIRKKEKKSKGKQDVKMAEVGHDAEHAIGVDMADEVGQTKGKGQKKQSEGRNGSIDMEMAEVECVETKVGISVQLETDMAQATPAIVIEPLTPSPDKGKGQEIQPPVSENALVVAEVQGKNPSNLFFLTNWFIDNGLTLVPVDYMGHSFTLPPIPIPSWPEASSSLLKSWWVSPTKAEEVHHKWPFLPYYMLLNIKT